MILFLAQFCPGDGVGVPAQLIQSRNAVGLGYRYEFRAVSMGGSGLSLSENLHTIEGYYAPVSPLVFGLGFGVSGVLLDLADQSKPPPDIGLAPQFQVSLRTPGLLRDRLRAVGGVETGMLVVRSDKRHASDCTGWNVFPCAGIIFSPARVVDWQIGAGALFAQSRIKDSTGIETSYSGNQLLRVRSCVNLHSVETGAFLNLGAALSPLSSFQAGRMFADPSISLELGCQMRKDAEYGRLSQRIERLFPQARASRIRAAAMEKSLAARMKDRVSFSE